MTTKERILDRFQGRSADFYGTFVDVDPHHNGSIKIRSPFREEAEASFQISLEGKYAGRWHDFGSNEHGDLFSFYARLKNMDTRKDFPGVLDGICADFGIQPATNGTARPTKSVRSLAERRITEDTSRDFEIREITGDERFDKRVDPNITFPVYGQDGQIIGSKIHKGCHLKADGTTARKGEGVPPQLYPWKGVDHDQVYLLNGEPSVWKAWDVGYRNVIASTGGEGKFKAEWASLFEQKVVNVVLDNDEAGYNATEKVCKLLHEKAAIVRAVQWPDGWKKKGDAEDWLQCGRRLEELEFIPWTPSKANSDSEPESEVRSSQADRLVQLAVIAADLFYDQANIPYTRISVGPHKETLRVQSRSFKRWLSRQMYEAEGKVPGREAMSSALNVIEAKACFEGRRIVMNNRVARVQNEIWYDLTDEHWRAVRVTSRCWEVVENPPPLFIRHAHQSSQVIPVRCGDINRLFDFIRVADDDSRLLLKIYVVTCLVPDIPHPMPVLHGPQGSGKSTLFKMLRRVIDPSIIDVLSFPRNPNELVQALNHHWMPLFDNVSNLPDWTSDALCRAVTGGGFTKRQLYTDDEDIVYSFQRCVGVNGINVAATKPDLLDRCILIALDRIPPAERLIEGDLWRNFNNELPVILGGALDLLSVAMDILPKVEVPNLPRMADFALWGCAVAEALGESEDAFLRAYGKNIETQNAEAIQGHPVASAIMMFMQQREEWEGTPSELLAALEAVAEKEHIDVKEKLWPKAPNALSRRLNEVRSNLVDAGILWKPSGSSRRGITIWKETENTVLTVGASSNQ
jgi:hypothetical protein